MTGEQLIHAEPGVRAHSKRVAALAQYAATALDLHADLTATLLDSCRLHHLAASLFKASSLDRLLRDMGEHQIGEYRTGEPSVVPATAAVLRLWAGNAERVDETETNLLMAAILDASNAFDECFEWLPFDPRPVHTVVNECLDTVIAPPLAKVFRTLRSVDPRTLEAAIENTPMASEVAIHARDIAVRARTLASASHMPGGLAFEAGLVHDCGSAVRNGFASVDQSALICWQEAGFPPVYCERLVSGSDHADWGARLLELGGRAPAAVIEAVRAHHRPEVTNSRLAALLYLAEEEAGSEEDLPSTARIKIARTLAAGA